MDCGNRKLHTVSDQAVQLYFTIRDIVWMVSQQNRIDPADIQRSPVMLFRQMKVVDCNSDDYANPCIEHPVQHKQIRCFIKGMC